MSGIIQNEITKAMLREALVVRVNSERAAGSDAVTLIQTLACGKTGLTHL